MRIHSPSFTQFFLFTSTSSTLLVIGCVLCHSQSTLLPRGHAAFASALMSPVSSTSPLSGSGSELSSGLRLQVRALFICAADLRRVVGVHFRDPDLPPSIVIPQAPHFPTPTFTRT